MVDIYTAVSGGLDRSIDLLREGTEMILPIDDFKKTHFPLK
ncbi:protein of unknown function [Maridesulfovibrio hydrothermalis AM13 = DSM 14728]|uniref:Uncharacterized protein n=1 Tax=Maridesulfovibrio hydrothermalis AM13 = DSM 14728 TaxID=1121451 RepID=L0R9F3_9BACT|nr:protein of unknown function [Maridesulfovibrio hydrothermalis AM13 = DSM 14728]